MTKKVGNNIKKIRMERGYSQLKLSELCGWDSQSRVSNYEAGAREPSLSDLRVIAKALDANPYELIASEFDQEINSSPTFELPIYSWNNISIKENSPIKIIKKIAPKGSYGLQVEDDSMTTGSNNPSFPTGTIVIVDPSKKPEVNNLVIARHKSTEKILFRKLSDMGLYPKLMPLNPLYDIYHVEDFDILGVVVASMNLDL